MSVYLCHEEPDLYEHVATIVDYKPGAVLLSRSALHPGGGGQVPDRGTIEHSGGIANIIDVVHEGDDHWHVVDAMEVIEGEVLVRVDAPYRHMVASLHTDTHILNALVFEEFNGALVTGAQIYGDGTARMDFDVPDADNDILRGLESGINSAIRESLAVRAEYVPASEAEATPGLIRSMSVTPPPTPDGQLRIINIVALDRQACGGTHLSSTEQSPPIRITKVENKGRHNRRVRLAFRDEK